MPFALLILSSKQLDFIDENREAGETASQTPKPQLFINN